MLCRQLHALSDLLSPGLQESYAESCDALIQGDDPVGAAQEIQLALREGLPENLLPEGFLETLVTCLTQFSHNRACDTVQLARSGVFWVNMGLLQIQVWVPQTIFDPAVKRAYKLKYAQDEVSPAQTKPPTTPQPPTTRRYLFPPSERRFIIISARFTSR